MGFKIKRYFYWGLALMVCLGFLMAIVAYILGSFSKVEIKKEVRGPYLMVYMPHLGAYHLVQEKIERVGKLLDEKKIPKSIPCALFHDDPRDVPVESLRSEGGYLVNQRVNLDHPFGQQEIPKREVIVARVRAHPFIAPFKTYHKIVEYMKTHRLGHNGPGMELYLPEGIVEVEIPFRYP